MSVYVTKDAFELYMYFLAIKRHFTSNYDFFKYNGKVKANAQSFENRKDKFFFYKLSKRKEARDLILANVLVDPDIWVGNLLEEKANEVYKSWLKRKQSLTYQFKSDIKELHEDFNRNFVVESGQHPHVLRLYMMKRICLESLVILTETTGCLPYWEKKISDPVVFPSINKLVVAYRPFLNYERNKMKNILFETFAHNAQ
jgi:hypothetical protein